MASFHNVANGSPGGRRDTKPAGRLAALFINRSNSRSQSEPGILAAGGRRYLPPSVPPPPPKAPDLMPQGKALNISKVKPPAPVQKQPDIASIDYLELIASEEDERYRYLLKHGNVKKVEDEDKILYAELPQIPGVLVVYRKPSERNANPERLNLDRRELVHLPLLEGEEKLRLLNFQHNAIQKIENLVSLPNLIFLDLYSNQIRDISGLHTVPTLRVLMLGKNLIEKIKNIQHLTKLDVLDLHSNQIAKIENISHLAELRVLNLANNQIAVVENLDGLTSLTELNLRRNKIETIASLDTLPKLQRLFLSNNKIAEYDAVACLGKCAQLGELAMDGNPVFNLPEYSHWVQTTCFSLRILDSKKLAKDTKDIPKSPIQKPMPPAPIPEESIVPITTPANANLLTAIQKEWKDEVERLRSKGLNFFRRRKELQSDCLVQTGNAELEGETHLFLYGNSLEVLQKQEFKSSVQQITFKFLRFDMITQQANLSEMRRFPSLKSVVFSDNNLHSFTHLSKLECLSTITSISVENNDICHSVLCRSFIIYRFPQIKEVSNVAVSDSDRSKARQEFQQFDRVLSAPNLFTPKVFAVEDKEIQKVYRLKMKKNTEFAVEFVNKLISCAIQTEAKSIKLQENWDKLTLKVTKWTTEELSLPNSVTEGLLKERL